MERTLKHFLQNRGVRYEILEHPRTITAMETAQATHVDGIELAKVVVVRVDGELQMVVVPATHQVDLEKLQMHLKATFVELADEADFANCFPDCEPGAMPPFGHLYDMKLYASETLLLDDSIVFNAGSHSEAVRVSLADYLRTAAPLVLNISRPRELV